jgi:hypothetical protein
VSEYSNRLELFDRIEVPVSAEQLASLQEAAGKLGFIESGPMQQMSTESSPERSRGIELARQWRTLGEQLVDIQYPDSLEMRANRQRAQFGMELAYVRMLLSWGFEREASDVCADIIELAENDADLQSELRSFYDIFPNYQ